MGRNTATVGHGGVRLGAGITAKDATTEHKKPAGIGARRGPLRLWSLRFRFGDLGQTKHVGAS